MGAINLLTDATSAAPVLPARSLTLICGGGEIQRNEHADALFDYDGTVDAMRRIVTALFFDPGYPRMTTTSGADTHRARHPAPGRRSPPRGSAGPVRRRRRRRRRRGLTSASPCRRSSSKGRGTSCCRAVGPPTSPPESPAHVRRWSTRRATVHSSNGRRSSTHLLLEFLEGNCREMTKNCRRQGGDRHRRRVRHRTGHRRAVPRRGRQGGDRRRAGRTRRRRLPRPGGPTRTSRHTDVGDQAQVATSSPRRSRRSAACTSWSTTPAGRAR